MGDRKVRAADVACPTHGRIRWEDRPIEVGGRFYCPVCRCTEAVSPVLHESLAPTALDRPAATLRAGSL